MQTIYLNKFGVVLVSRPAGLEAFQAIRPALDVAKPVQIDFSGVVSVTPSWFDEFLTHLAEFMQGKVELLPTKNASVQAMLPVLAQDRDDRAGQVMRQALESFSVSR